MLALFILEQEEGLRKKITIVALFVIELVLVVRYSTSYMVLFPVLLLKIRKEMKSRFLFLVVLIGLMFCNQIIWYGMSMLFAIMISYYEEEIEGRYKKMTRQFMQNEDFLQTTLEKKESLHKWEMESFALNFEKQRLSEETKEKLQVIIDHLRGSMDEIRQILREEKPKSSQMNELKLRSFCKEFEVQYDIGVHLILEGDLQKIMEPLWKVLFECIFEAFSNALKYAKCNQIEVRLMIFN